MRIEKGARALCIIAFVFACSLAANAQMEIGDNLKLNLNGTTGYNYTGTFGDDSGSNHGQGLLFDFDGRGYYFAPQFLSFDFHPYFNRNQTNSSSQSIFRNSGVGASASIFGGSRFPGSITWGKDFSNSSSFTLVGVPTITSDGSSQNFGVSWSALLPKWPQITASFAKSSSVASFESVGDSKSAGTSLNLAASYRLWSWDVQGGMSRNTANFDSPKFLTGAAFTGDSSGMSYYATTGHSLPLRGSFSVGWGHSTSDSSAGYSYGTTSYSASNTFNPFSRFSIFQNVNYVSNLSGMVLQSLSGGIYTSGIRQDFNSWGYTYGTGASYYVGRGISVGGYYNHRFQNFQNIDSGGDQYGGNINFTHSNRLFGFLNFGLGVADTAGVSGNNGASLSANLGASKNFGHWETSADFNYGQNIMTLGTFSTTSNYSYGGSLRRKVNREMYFGGSYRASHSGLVVQSGDGSRSNSTSGQFHWTKYTFAGGYSQADGSAVLTSSGTLVAATPAALTVAELMLFNAKSYNFSASTVILRRFDVTGGYASFSSETQARQLGTLNRGTSFNATMQYRLRKFQLGAGYSHTEQQSSTVAGGPRRLNSFYVSLSRWFNVF